MPELFFWSCFCRFQVPPNLSIKVTEHPARSGGDIASLVRTDSARQSSRIDVTSQELKLKRQRQCELESMSSLQRMVDLVDETRQQVDTQRALEASMVAANTSIAAQVVQQHELNAQMEGNLANMMEMLVQNAACVGRVAN